MKGRRLVVFHGINDFIAAIVMPDLLSGTTAPKIPRFLFPGVNYAELFSVCTFG